MNAKVFVLCIEQSNGSYCAMCPELSGCFTQGDTYEQAMANIKELISETVADGIDINVFGRDKTYISTQLDLAVSF